MKTLVLALALLGFAGAAGVAQAECGHLKWNQQSAETPPPPPDSPSA